MKLACVIIFYVILFGSTASIPFVIRHKNHIETIKINQDLCRQAQMKAWQVGYKSGQVSAMTGGFNYRQDSLEAAKIIFNQNK